MASTAELVNDTFALAQTYASAAETKLSTFASALEGFSYAPPTLSVNWQTLPAPEFDPTPDMPDMPTIEFNQGSIGPTPGTVSEDIPAIDIPEFSDVLDPLHMPDQPTLSYGAMPSIPSVGTVVVPDAPVVTLPDAPTYLSLSTVTFGGVDLREEWLQRLENAPELELLAPTPYQYTRGPAYASGLLDKLKAVLSSRMNGGTGLTPAVEAAILGRARDRETIIALGNESEVMRTHEAMGFPLPSGVLAAQLRQARRDYYGKLSDLSRDVAIKQADLEQQNLRDTIASGMQLEAQLIDYSYKLEQMTFEAARTMADNAIQVHNAQVQHFRALLEGYQSYASAYKTIIDGQLAKVEVYKAQLQAEQTKADINKVLVEQYKAQIEAGLSQVEIYRAQVGAAQTLVQLEQAKIQAAAEQVRGYVAQINAETSKVEAFKAGVQAEATKVDIYKTKAEVYTARVNAQAEKSRALVSRYQALIASNAAAWESYRARVGAETARIDALGRQSSALLEGFRAENAAVQANAELKTKVWETSMRQYDAGVNVSMQAAKINADAVQLANNARLDAVKAGTQVYAQLTSSAYSMMHASAGISGSSSMSVGYSYGGDVSGSVAPIPVAP